VNTDELKNIRLTITGAESLDMAFAKEYQKMTADEAILLEGYGITECSPILCVNPVDKQKQKSVGKFIEEISYKIVHPETLKEINKGEEGLILVKGPSVFNGYIDKNLASPFINTRDGIYYNSGDIGQIDEEGYLYLTGRLKRFIKIGGEMISLPAIEQVLIEKYGSNAEVEIAVEGNDKISPPLIVLFSKKTLNVREVNKYLREKGFSNLVKITKHVKVKEIPLLGTGKTDYKELKK
jgi:acyl-CoA synthetase (AMP-forming)/AMP-acid ligase II